MNNYAHNDSLNEDPNLFERYVLSSCGAEEALMMTPRYCRAHPLPHQVVHWYWTKRPTCGLSNEISIVKIGLSALRGSDNCSSTISVHGPSPVSPISTTKSFDPLKQTLQVCQKLVLNGQSPCDLHTILQVQRPKNKYTCTY